jgi:hypothetical protein
MNNYIYAVILMAAVSITIIVTDMTSSNQARRELTECETALAGFKVIELNFNPEEDK